MKAGTKEYYAEYYQKNKEKHNQKMKEWQQKENYSTADAVKKWQTQNIDRVREIDRFQKRKQNKEKRQFINGYKQGCTCKKCGEDRFYVLDFHHINPSEKEFNLGEATKYSITKLKAELEKCITLCRNCHSEFHFFEKERGITINDFLTNVAE